MKFRLIAFVLVSSLFTLPGCKMEDPAPENIPELITKATLTFVPMGGTPIVVTATDPDGVGVQDLTVDGPINLAKNNSYRLNIELINGLYAMGEEGYSISNEIMKEADEHLFFFAWTDGVFSNPSGNGNMDNRTDPVQYVDEDVNHLPLGLETDWTTGSGATSKTFKIVLKHQPGIKSVSSSATDGESDLDISFTLNVN